MKSAKLKIPPAVKQCLLSLKKKGFDAYVVGGAVRNLLLDKAVDNWDFATSATPQQIQDLFPDSFYHNTYGTVSLSVDIYIDGSLNKTLFEITPFRKESQYKDNRHPGKIEWAATIEEDLGRRDFTINAIAYDGNRIIDPFEGRKHLMEKLIVSVGDPDKRFREDALRLIRAIRFASQLGFLIDEKTRNSITLNSRLIINISWERIRDEFLKILASNHPAEGILFLRSTGILKYILPEVESCFTIPQKSPKRHHIYDVGTHLVMALKNCPSSDPITRFATLIHDIGKTATFHKDEATGLITFYNHEVAGTYQTQEIARRFRLSKEQTEKLITLVKHHQFTVSEEITDKAVRRFIRDVGKEFVQDMLDLRTGDRIGSGAAPTSWRYELFKKRIVEVQKEPFTVKDLKIDGHDIMKTLHMQPGKQIGDILEGLFEGVVNGKIKNERTALLQELSSLPRVPDK